MNWIKNLALLLFSLVFSIFCVELIVRLSVPIADLEEPVVGSYGLSDAGSTYGFICEHGWCANPGSYSDVTKKIKETDEVIYSVQYSIGENNLRITPKVNLNASIFMRYFGGSYTFGEGLNDIQTMSYLSQVANDNVDAVNLGFHGYGPHNALMLLQSLDSSEGAFNLLLTGSYHAFRSACIPSFSRDHPRYELEEGVLVYKGRCKSQHKDDKGWILDARRIVDNIKSYIDLSSLKIISEYLSSSITSYQIDLYQNIIFEFHRQSLARGETPVILYIFDERRSYLLSGFFSDPNPRFFESKGINYIDVTLPDEPKFYLHERDKHPSARANCERVQTIFDNLNIDSKSLDCL